MPMRILQGHRPRKLVAFFSRWLAAFSAGDAPETITTSLGTGKSRHYSPAEQAASEKLFARYHRPLLDYLYGMTRDREIAEDLVQEAFLRAYTAGTTLANVNHPQAWLYRIATNVALDSRRRQRRFTWLPLGRLEPEAGSTAGSGFNPLPSSPLLQDDFAADIAERDAVWCVLAELPIRWRAVLLLGIASVVAASLVIVGFLAVLGPRMFDFNGPASGIGSPSRGIYELVPGADNWRYLAPSPEGDPQIFLWSSSGHLAVIWGGRGALLNPRGFQYLLF